MSGHGRFMSLSGARGVEEKFIIMHVFVDSSAEVIIINLIFNNQNDKKIKKNTLIEDVCNIKCFNFF